MCINYTMLQVKGMEPPPPSRGLEPKEETEAEAEDEQVEDATGDRSANLLAAAGYLA